MSAEDPASKRKRAANSYMRLSGIGFQMAAIIGIGAYGGWWTDQRTGWEFPVGMFSVCAIEGPCLHLRPLKKG